MPLAQAGREQRFRPTVSTLRCCFFAQLVGRLLVSSGTDRST